MTRDQHWTAYGACSAASPDDLFVEGAAQRAAREVCGTCSVRIPCLIDALDNKVAFGVWGGTTERQRRALIRRHPDVASWRELVEADPELVAFSGGYRGATVSATVGPAGQRERAAGR